MNGNLVAFLQRNAPQCTVTLDIDATLIETSKEEALAPIQNKLGAFLTTPLVRNIVGLQQNNLDREVMNRVRILLINLAKGRIGEDNSFFLGSIIIVKLQLTAMSRIDVPEESEAPESPISR